MASRQLHLFPTPAGLIGMRRREFMGLAGGTAIWPLAGRAQQQAMRAIGYIGSGSSHDVASPFVVALRQGLGETGYVEGQNLAIEYRWRENMIGCPYSRPTSSVAM